IETRQDGDAEDEDVVTRAGAEHGGASRCMHRHHRYAKRGGNGARISCGVRDVVDFQVKENLVAPLDKLVDQARSVGDECLQADLETASGATKIAGQPQHVIARGAVECNDEAVARLHGRMIAVWTSGKWRRRSARFRNMSS